MSESTLAFGIEVQLLFKPNGALIRKHMSGWTAGLDHSQKTNPARVNREVLRRAIARELTGAGVEAGVSTQGYDMWSVMDEPTLDERPDFCKDALQKERYTPLSEVYGILHHVVVVRYTLSEYTPGYWTIPQSTLQCVVYHTISEYIRGIF